MAAGVWSKLWDVQPEFVPINLINPDCFANDTNFLLLLIAAINFCGNWSSTGAKPARVCVFTDISVL